jgi:hypothetical protein
VTRRLPAGGLDPLVDSGHELVQRDDDLSWTHDELVEAAPDVDAIVCLLTDRIDGDVLAAGAPRLKSATSTPCWLRATSCRCTCP